MSSGRELDGSRLGARFGHADQHALFLRRKSLDGGDEIGNQVRAPLVLVDDLRPGGLHRLVLVLQLVVAAAGEADARDAPR